MARTMLETELTRILEQIFDDPTQAPTLLAENLPGASTFYLSFFVLQGLAVTASTIFQIGPFLIFNIASPFLDTTPRKKFERWITLSGISWGDTYPKFTLFAVIGGPINHTSNGLHMLIGPFSNCILVHRSVSSRICCHRPLLPLSRISLQRFLRRDHDCRH